MSTTRPTDAIRTPRRGWRTWLVLVGAIACSQAAIAQPVEQELSREQIADARARAETRYQQQRWECSHRFIVTACMEDARAEYRASLQALDRREAEIDRALRHQRAQQRLAIIQRKTEALAPAPAPQPAAERADAQPQPGIAGAEQPPRSTGNGTAVRSNDVAAAERAARARAEASQRRRAEAEQRRVEREQRRQAEQKTPAAGLPQRPLIPLPDN